MVFTDRLVFIHLPKTGGTFVAKILRDIHRRRVGPVAKLKGRLLGWGYTDTNKHGTCDEIPPELRDRPVLGIMRNPYDRYVSRYEYGWWKENPRSWWDWDRIRAKYPKFPELSFPEFLDACSGMFHKVRVTGVPEEARLGSASEEFVRWYFRTPEAVFPRIDDAYIAARAWEKDMHPVKFLRTETLNRDLHAALIELGYPADSIEFILKAEKVLPPGGKPRGGEKWEKYYTPELKALVRRRERLLFALFPEYDR
jgi:hypothetical protein